MVSNECLHLVILLQVTISTHNPKRKGHQLLFTGPVNPPSTFGFDKLASDACALVVPSVVAERDLINVHAAWNKRVMPVTFQIMKVQQEQ